MPLRAPQHATDQQSIDQLLTKAVESLKKDRKLWATLEADPELKTTYIQMLREDLEMQLDLDREWATRQREDRRFWNRFFSIFAAG